MDGPLGAGRATLLKWLVEAGDRGRQDANAAQVRAKAVKALGGVVEVDTRVLGLQELRLGLQNALRDEAVSVREAAVELLAKYLSSNPELAAEYFEVICTACNVSICIRLWHLCKMIALELDVGLPYVKTDLAWVQSQESWDSVALCALSTVVYSVLLCWDRCWDRAGST